MRKNNKFKRKPNFDQKQILLGKVLHFAEKQPVVKIEAKKIPYPNLPVLYNNREIGKVDEVFGTLTEPYCSITLTKEFSKKDVELFAYDCKFMPRERFLNREDTEKRKEKKDKEGNKDKGKPEGIERYGKFDDGKKWVVRRDNKNGKMEKRYNDTRIKDGRKEQRRFSKDRHRQYNKK